MFDLPVAVRLSREDVDFPIFEIDHPKCKARIALHGAQVLAWLPANEAEVLYLSPESHFTEGKAIRGGIPLCWPWFSAHGSDPTQPSHGFARTRFWELESVCESEAAVTFRFATQAGNLAAIAEIIVGDALEVRLITTNVGETTAWLGGALHSYFQVSDVSEIAVEGLENSCYLDTLSGIKENQQVGAIRVAQEIDAIFQSECVVRIIDAPMERVIVIEKSGCPSTVVWNPWIAKARSLSDLPDEGYRQFICVEPAIVNAETITLACNERYTFSTKIRLEAYEKMGVDQ